MGNSPSKKKIAASTDKSTATCSKRNGIYSEIDQLFKTELKSIILTQIAANNDNPLLTINCICDVIGTV